MGSGQPGFATVTTDPPAGRHRSRGRRRRLGAGRPATREEPMNPDQATADWPGTYVQQVTAPPAQHGPDAHLSTPEVVQLFFNGWLSYLSEGTGLGREAAFEGSAVP